MHGGIHVIKETEKNPNMKCLGLSRVVSILLCTLVIQQILIDILMYYMYVMYHVRHSKTDNRNLDAFHQPPLIVHDSFSYNDNNVEIVPQTVTQPVKFYLRHDYLHTNQDYTVNNVFDQVYLINRKKDKRNLEIMQRKFKKYGISYQIFQAIDGIPDVINITMLRSGNKGAVGLKQTQMNIVKDAKKHHYKKILICEDDLVFLKRFKYAFHRQYDQIMHRKYRHWNLLYLGSSYHWRKEIISPHNIPAIRAYGNFAVGVDESIYDIILSYEYDDRPIDDIFVEEFQETPGFKSVVLNPMLITADVKKTSSTDGIYTDWVSYYNENNITLANYDFPPDWWSSKQIKNLWNWVPFKSSNKQIKKNTWKMKKNIYTGIKPSKNIWNIGGKRNKNIRNWWMKQKLNQPKS